ncbi:hypothetical protein HK102_008199 [Quaeritorhiza haematococci]|nr:hypothetical protein HK102_008199 [Quaeritorhiza haematococci]
MSRHSNAAQLAIHNRSLVDPVAFWGEIADNLIWNQKCKQVFTRNEKTIPYPHYRWFPDGALNICYNAVDRHVELEGRGNNVAIIYDSPVTGVKKKITFRELQHHVATLAAVLAGFGVKKGDSVLIYMPAVPEAVFAMLACARLGAMHSVVFGGFAPKELTKRIQDCKPNIVLSASCGIEPTKIVEYKPFLDQAIDMCSHKPQYKLIFERPQCLVDLDQRKGEFSWIDQVAAAESAGKEAPCIPVASNDYLFLLYTSGSTGVPKGVVHETGPYAVGLTYSMKDVMGVKPGDVFFAASDVGWVVGHSFIVYGPLLVGCTTVLFEGKPTTTPDAGAFWRLVQEYRIKVLYTAPTAIRSIKREDPNGEYVKRHDISSLKSLFLVGERSDPDTVVHFSKLLNVPVRDNYWQTETGWTVTAPCAMDNGHRSTQPRPGSAGLLVAGFDVKALVPKNRVDEGDDASARNVRYVEAEPNQLGNIVIKLPLPPGTFPTLYKNHTGYVKSYLTRFPGFYDTSDSGYFDEDGYIYVMSRTDDIINTAGHRLSTGGIEQVVAANPAVAECAVVGAADPIKGEKPLGVGFIVLKKGITTPNEMIAKQAMAAVRSDVGPIACFDKVFVVEKLPKTRSGKILRRTLRAITNGVKYQVPATIEDESVLKVIEQAVGYPSSTSDILARL